MRILGGYTPCYMFIQTQVSSQVGDIPINPYINSHCVSIISPFFAHFAPFDPFVHHFLFGFGEIRNHQPRCPEPLIQTIRPPNGACENGDLEGRTVEKGSANHVGHVDGQGSASYAMGYALVNVAMGNGQPMFSMIDDLAVKNADVPFREKLLEGK